MNKPLNGSSKLKFLLLKLIALVKNLEYKITDKGENSLGFNKKISLNHIYYHYPNASRTALKDINLSIPVLNTVGLVGTTGSGKTTIADIILSLLEAQQGTLKVDGIVLNKHNQKAWQRSIGYVPQQIFLLDDSIKRNIAFGINEKFIDDEKVMNAIETAQLSEFVDTLPKGLNTRVGERGSLISGGQLQRIAIARALYNEPDLIVMDEATSALDEETEKSLMNAILTIKGTKTILIISHRNSTIHGCDREINLNNN